MKASRKKFGPSAKPRKENQPVELKTTHISDLLGALTAFAQRALLGALAGSHVYFYYVFMLLFAMMDKVLPDVRIEWRDVCGVGHGAQRARRASTLPAATSIGIR